MRGGGGRVRLGIIGPCNSVSEVIETIGRVGLPVDVVPLSYDILTEIPDILGRHQLELDGILFTGQIPFDYAIHYVQAERPWGFLAKDKLSLVFTLLKAGFVKKYDITKVSVDNCEEHLVFDAYKEIGYDREHLHVVFSDHSLFSDSYIEDLIKFHKERFRSDEVACCITGVDAVYRGLTREGVPCMMNSKSSDTIIREINKLLMSVQFDTSDTERFAAIIVELELLEDHPVYGRNILQLMHIKNRLRDIVYVYAQKIGAAIVDVQGERFCMFARPQSLINETDGLRCFSMLEAVQLEDLVKNTFVGAGIASNAFLSQQNAELAVRRARSFSTSCMFVVYEDRRINGPIVASTKNRALVLDRDMQIVAEHSGVGIKSVNHLDSLIRQYGIEFITPSRLAMLYGGSMRNIHRILQKLEDSGYVHTVGKEHRSGPGRPERIIRINL